MKTVTATDTIVGMVKMFQEHDLGNVYSLQYILQYLDGAGLSVRPEAEEGKPYRLDNEFIKRVAKFAQTHILREFKHEARIPIEDAHQLVGVVDEGPAWLEAGVQDVFCLQDGQIFGKHA